MSPSAICTYARGSQRCEREAKRGWTTCPAHYTAGRRRESMTARAHERLCGSAGYICPMCESGVFPPDYDPCPHCQHDSTDHESIQGSSEINCTLHYVDPITDAESFCDCVWNKAES